MLSDEMWKSWTVLLCTVAACARHASADIIISRNHSWDIGEHGWTNEFGNVTLTRETAGGNPPSSGWLSITFPPTGNPELGGVGWYDIVHVNPDNLLATYRTGVEFDFLAVMRLPNELQFQFHSTGGNIWGFDLTDQVTDTKTWTTMHVPLTYSDAWGGLPGFDDTLDQFVSDLASVDWIGLYIWREEPGQEVYGVDNFHFLVPEPAEIALLAVALVTSGIALRKRQEDAVSTAPG